MIAAVIAADLAIGHASTTEADWSRREEEEGGKPVAYIERQASLVQGQQEPVSLVVICEVNGVDVFVFWHSYIGHDTDVSLQGVNFLKNVYVSTGEAPIVKQEWLTTGNMTAAQAPVPLLRKMIAAERLTIQTYPFRRLMVTAVFPMDGLRDLLRGGPGACARVAAS